MSTLNQPLIAVIGTTGTGKSQLAIELGLALAEKRSEHAPWTGAKVINADAMQVYKGLDVVTNKVTEEEKHGVEHRLMDFKHPGEEYFVSEWIKDSLKEIEDSHAHHDVPIVVGGTTYWIQHLVFPNRLVSLDGEDQDTPALNLSPTSGLSPALSQLPEDLLTLYQNLPDRSHSETCSNEEAFALHSLLKHLDSPMGSRWHWRDTRKVLRSLEIIKETGQRASDVIEAQEAIGSARYPTLIFWLYADPTELNPRLDARVDKMIKRGLIEEIKAMRESAGTPSSPTTVAIDYTQGVYQTIGFKEFDAYLSDVNSQEDLLTQSLDQMKHATRKYAQRQVKWIQNKLLPAVRSQGDQGPQVTVVLLDATDLSSWNESVSAVALQTMTSFLRDGTTPDPLSISQTAGKMLGGHKLALRSTDALAARRRVICPVCTTDPSQPVMIEEGAEWKAHARSRAHSSREGKERRIAEQLAARERKQRERAERRSPSRD